MYWDDLCTVLGEYLGQPLKVDGRFTPTKARQIFHEIQSEIAQRSLCVLVSSAGATVSGTEIYSLPLSFIKMQQVRLSGYEEPIQIAERPNNATSASGVPTMWYIVGNNIGFYPVPNAAITYSLYHYWRPPEYALRITHAAGNNGSTACTFTTTASSLVLSITGGTDSGTTISFAATATDTVSEVVAAINALGRGFTATAHPDAGSLVFTTEGVDIRSAVNIEGVDDYVFFRPKIPTQARDLLLHGAVERFKLKEREITFEQYQNGMFYSKLAEFTKDWKSRISNTRNMGIKRTRRGGGRGAAYTGDAGVPVIYIP